MITEDYVSFETAKLLKEKGFDGPCFRYAESKEIYESGNWTVANVTGGCVGVPTLQTAMKWLREKYGQEIYPFHDVFLETDTWWYRIEIYLGKGCFLLTEHESDAIYVKYEEACEAAIKYCLENLI